MNNSQNVEKQGRQTETAEDLINRHMQDGPQELSTSYTADLIYEITCAEGLTEEAKIERIKAELDNYRVGILKNINRY